MANVGQNILVVSIAVIGSILLQAGLNHIWPWEKRGGMDGFWGCRAEGLEANAVVDMHHLAKGLPEPQRTQLQTLAGSYADTVITRDWPQMARGEVPEETEAIKSEMWDTVISVRAASATEITAQQHALSQLSSLDQHRLTRIRQSATNLGALVCSLAGGALTIISACTFGAGNMKLQTLQVLSFSLLVFSLAGGDR